MRMSIHARFLTNAYFGSTSPIEGGRFTESLQMPSIYAFAGALATRLFEDGIPPEGFIQNVVEGNIRLYGIYIYYTGYFVPITAQVIDKNYRFNINTLKDVENYASTSMLHRRVMMPKFEGLSKDERKKSYFIDLSNMQNNVRSDIIDMHTEVRARTALNYSTKVPEEGMLFSLSVVTKPDVTYCMDIELPDTYKLDSEWIGHFGGESSLAEFTISSNTPLLELIEKRSKTGRYLAVSHIPLKLLQGELLTPLGRVQYIIGRVSSLGGWDIRGERMKKIYACIEPGSIFAVDNEGSAIAVNTGEEWYLKLLNSAVQI
ncbi:MAG: hypothetical protein NZ517_08500 [Candidatus Nitrosocaldus sp.]|nr:hypothetical protein [Candidatus Nitrosocaldus sp.]